MVARLFRIVLYGWTSYAAVCKPYVEIYLWFDMAGTGIALSVSGELDSNFPDTLRRSNL